MSSPGAKSCKLVLPCGNRSRTQQLERSAGSLAASAGHWGVGGDLKDVTSQRRLEPGLIDEVRALQVINQTGALIASKLELDRIVHAVVDAGVELTGADVGAFFYNIVGEDGAALQLYALAGADPAHFATFPHPRATPVFAPTFHGEGVVRSDDITQDPRYGRMGPHHGMPPGHLPVRSYLAVPVISRTGEVLGGLIFGHTAQGRFGAAHERIMVGVAAQAASAIDNARLFEAARAEIERRRAAEHSLGQAERRLKAILDNATVAIFLMDDRQHCVFMNAAAEQLTGYRLEDTQGRPLHDVIHHTRPDGSPFPLEECAIDRAFPENNQQQGEEVFVHRTGRFYPVAFTASPVRDEAGATIGTVIEVRDITREKRDEETRALLMREVDHRARNALAVVQSLVRLTDAEDLEAYKATLLGRISALARAQGNLSERRWEGAALRELVCNELMALAPENSFEVAGPDLLLVAEHAQPVSMILHELATNAAKHGALGSEGGRVRVEWRTDGDELLMDWRELNGPSVTAPQRTGFGSRLIQQLARQVGATVEKRWEPNGLHAAIRLSLKHNTKPV